MDEQQTNGISRRSFFKVALGSIVTLPAVAGGFLLPIDGSLEPKEALAEGERTGATTTVVIAQAYEAGIFVVDTRGGAMSPVPNAKVTIFSHYNQKTISGTTNDKGLWLADIREVAKKENIHGVDRYSFYARMDIEAAGYRLFRSRRMGIDGAKGFQVPTRKLEGETVYPMGVALDDWDVLYTKNEFCVAQGNDAKHTFAVDMHAEGGSPVTVSICEGDKRKVVASAQYAPQSGVLAAELSDFFLLKDHKSALTIGSKYYLRYNAGGKDFELALQLTTVGAPTGVTAPGSTNVTLDPFNVGSMKPQIEIPGWVPIIGGTNIAVWTPDLPVEILFNPFGYFKIAYRSEERGYKGKNGEPDPNAWKSHPRKTFEEQANAAWQERENTMKKVGQAQDREGVLRRVEVCKAISATAMLAAYAAGRWDYQGALWRGSAGIVGTLAFNFTYGQQFFAGPVPMVFEFSFLASISIGVEVAVSTPEIFTPSKYSLDPGSTGINITLTIMPAISLGVGVRGVLSASVQGMLQFTTFVHYGPLPENIGNRNISKTHVVVGVTAKVNVVIQALIFTTVIPVNTLSKSIPDLYDNWKGDTVKAEAEADVFAEADDWDTVFGTDFSIVPSEVIDEVSEFEVSGWIADEETKKEDGWDDWEYWDDEDAWDEWDEDEGDWNKDDWITWGDGSEEEMDYDNWYFIDDDEADERYDGFIYSRNGFGAGKIAAESADSSPAKVEMVPKLVEETTSCTTEDGLPFTMTSFGVEMVPAGGTVAAEATKEEQPAIEQVDEAPAEAAIEERPATAEEQPAAPDLEAVEGAQAAAASPNEATDASAQAGAAVTAAVAGDALAVAPEELAVEAEEAPLAEDPAAALQQGEDDAAPAQDGAVAAQAEPADGEHQAAEQPAIEEQVEEEAITESQEGAEAPVEAEATTAAASKTRPVHRVVKTTNKMGEIPKAASVSRLAVGNGIRPKSDKKVLENIYGDPRTKIIQHDLGTRVFRIASVKVKDEKGNEVSRTRVVCSMLGNSSTQTQVVDFDIRFKFYDKEESEYQKANAAYLPKRSDLYDYDFDIALGRDSSYYSNDFLVHFFIISGRRPKDDNTTIAEAASDLVFTHAIYEIKDGGFSPYAAYSHLVNNERYCTTGYKDDAYYSLSCPHIEYMSDTNPAEKSKYEKDPAYHNMPGRGCVITFLARSSNNRDHLLKNEDNVHVGLGVFIVSGDYRSYKFFSVDTSNLISEETRADKTIFEVLALPPTKVAATDNGPSSNLVPILLRGHEKTYYYLLRVTMASKIVDDIFVPEFKSLKVLNAAYNGDTAKVPKRLVHWPGHKELLASVDNKLMKVTINDADGDSPSLSYENCGPDTFAISAFGTDESGTFIYWPTTREGSPGYDYEKSPHEPAKAPALPEIKRYQVLACKLRNGKFSDPFVFAEVEHDMDNLIPVGTAQEYMAAEFVSTHLSIDEKTGKPTGKADLWYTSIPNVACMTIIGVECLAGVVFPGQSATFYLTVRNDGNTYIKEFVPHLLLKGDEHEYYSEATVVLSEQSLVESCFNPRGEDGKLLNVEEDYTLAPGKTAVYKADFVISKLWSGSGGKQELFAFVSTCTVAKITAPVVKVEGIGAEGVEAEATYTFDDSKYIEYIAGTNEDDWGDEGQPFDIVSFGYEDDNRIADAPITTPGTGSTGQAKRAATPRTADDTHSALPLGLAAAGAGFMAYSKRRERLEGEED